MLVFTDIYIYYYFFSEPQIGIQGMLAVSHSYIEIPVILRVGLVLDFQKDVCLVSSPDLDPTPDPHHSFLILVACPTSVR